MKRTFNLSKLMDNNKFLKVLSCIIAVLAWFVVTTTVDPNQTAVIRDVPLTIDLTGTPAAAQQLSVIEGGDQTISIRVEGKRYRIATLTADDFVVTPVLTDIAVAGDYTVQLSVQKKDVNDADFTIVSYPETVELSFDRVNSKEFDVEAVADGITGADGYLKESPSATPKKITITGAQAEIDQIARCVVVYDGSAVLDDTLTARGRLVLYDENGNELTLKHVSYSDTEFGITVPIYLQKDFPVEVSFINTNGLDTSRFNLTLSQNTVTIAGPKDVINRRENITVGPIDLSKLDIGSVFHFDLDLSAGELDIDNIGEIVVSVNTDGFSSRTMSLQADNILLRNTPADYDVTLRSTSINNIKMVGNADDIEKLSSSELVAAVDLKNIEEGTSRVRVTIYATGEKFVWAVGDYYVTVQAVKK